MPSWDDHGVIDTKITLLSFQQNKNIYYKRILKKYQGLR